MIRNRITVTNGADLSEVYDPDNLNSAWANAKAITERRPNAIARLQQSYFNEDTGETSDWETIAELRGEAVR